MNKSDNSEVYRVLASIVNFSDDGIITKTLEGVITSWNRGAEKIFGYKAHEVIGKHISVLIPPDRLEEEPEIIARIRRGELVDHYETQRRRKDGSMVHISLVVSATKDDDGNIIGILKIARDITLKKRADEIQKRMADIITLSDDGIYTKTMDGVITSWNKGAEKIYGYPRSEMVGKHVSLLIPPQRFDEEPMIMDRIARGESIDHYETERVTRDGKIVNISLSVSPVKESGERITGALIVARDITLTKRATERETWLASIINFSDDAIISKTLEGIITSWNRGAERIFGYTPDEVIGKHISILIPPGRTDEEPEIISKVSRGQYIHHYVTERMRKDGTTVNISLTVSPVKNAHGNIVGVSKIARDITEQKKREDEIKMLNRELEAFNYTVAHDLRSPLRAVMNYSQILLDKHTAVLPDDARHMVGRIVRQSQRMDVLIEDLMALSRLGLQPLEKSTIDMAALVKETVDEIQAHGNGKRLKINIHTLHNAWGDRSLLKQVWDNLIGNAVKYSRKTSAATIIDIGYTLADNNIVFYVRDNGIGFDMNYAPKLFKAFQRLHNNSEYEGTGIGLAIVDQIISKHGRKVWAEATPGQGATFYFSLPQ